MTVLLVVHAAATLAMAGIAWFVQVVHYPLFAEVGPASFAAYERSHTRRTTRIVAPLMLVEATTALLLAVLDPSVLTAAGLGLVVALWTSTAFVQVPCHRMLERGFDEAAWRRLVATSWLRTTLWTGRSGIALALLA